MGRVGAGRGGGAGLIVRSGEGVSLGGGVRGALPLFRGDRKRRPLGASGRERAALGDRALLLRPRRPRMRSGDGVQAEGGPSAPTL